MLSLWFKGGFIELQTISTEAEKKRRLLLWPIETMVIWKGGKGEKQGWKQAMDKIDSLVAIKKKISRWRLSY